MHRFSSLLDALMAPRRHLLRSIIATLVGAFTSAISRAAPVSATLSSQTSAVDIASPDPSLASGIVQRSPATQLTDFMNVLDFGAIGDGTMHTVAEWIGPGRRYKTLSALQAEYPWIQETSDSLDWAAIMKAAQYIKSLPFQGTLPGNCAGPDLLIPGGKKYMLNRTLFFGTDRDGPNRNYPDSAIMRVRGYNAILYFMMAQTGKVALDISGARFAHYEGISIVGDLNKPPLVGILVARGGRTGERGRHGQYYGRSSDDIKLASVNTDGAFSLCCYYEYAAEDVFLDHCVWRVTGGGAKCAVMLSKANQEKVPLEWQTLGPDGNQATYIGGLIQKCYLYFDVPAAGIPSDAATMIVWGSARHTYRDVFFSQANGAENAKPHVRLTGSNDAGDTTVRQTFDGCHFHAEFTHCIQVERNTSRLAMRGNFEGTGRAGATLYAPDGVTILDSYPLELSVLQLNGSSRLLRSDVVIATPGAFYVGGAFSGRLSMASNMQLAIGGAKAYERFYPDSGTSIPNGV